jgi:hypothetical protein
VGRCGRLVPVDVVRETRMAFLLHGGVVRGRAEPDPGLGLGWMSAAGAG